MAEETSGPWLAMAVICESALQEGNGVLSIIRVMERIQAQGPLPELQPFNIKFTLVVVLRSGFYQGNAKVAVKPVTPSNESLPVIEGTILLEGADRGANVIMQAPAFPIKEEGLYWFDVEVNGVLMTRIPLRVMYQQVSQLPGNRPPANPR
jgi:hypothetical protein